MSFILPSHISLLSFLLYLIGMFFNNYKQSCNCTASERVIVSLVLTSSHTFRYIKPRIPYRVYLVYGGIYMHQNSIKIEIYSYTFLVAMYLLFLFIFHVQILNKWNPWTSRCVPVLSDLSDIWYATLQIGKVLYFRNTCTRSEFYRMFLVSISKFLIRLECADEVPKSRLKVCLSCAYFYHLNSRFMVMTFATIWWLRGNTMTSRQYNDFAARHWILTSRQYNDFAAIQWLRGNTMTSRQYNDFAAIQWLRGNTMTSRQYNDFPRYSMNESLPFKLKTQSITRLHF